VILIPALVTLGITILRLVGELQHWARAWFKPEAGGPWSIVGITWLAPIFGIYFAIELLRAGEGPASSWRAIGVALLGWVVMIASLLIARKFIFPHSFKATLLFAWATWALAGGVQSAAWPSLFKVLLAYGYAARVPVALVMFLAFQGHWGTHYDALPPGWQSEGPWGDFVWLGFFPQLTLWVGFTIAAGSLFGTLGAATSQLFKRSPEARA
jgi:hypothetical protein